MYNFKKKCSDEKCGWANVYDSKDDFRHMEALEVCPNLRSMASFIVLALNTINTANTILDNPLLVQLLGI